MTEPEVIRTLRQDVRGGNVFLHDKHNEIVCATSVILQAYDELRAERDAAIKRAEVAEAERDALRKVDDAMVGRFLRVYAECEGERPQTFTHRIGVCTALTAVLAVQP